MNCEGNLFSLDSILSFALERIGSSSSDYDGIFYKKLERLFLSFPLYVKYGFCKDSSKCPAPSRYRSSFSSGKSLCVFVPSPSALWSVIRFCQIIGFNSIVIVDSSTLIISDVFYFGNKSGVYVYESKDL